MDRLLRHDRIVDHPRPVVASVDGLLLIEEQEVADIATGARMPGVGNVVAEGTVGTEATVAIVDLVVAVVEAIMVAAAVSGVVEGRMTGESVILVSVRSLLLPSIVPSGDATVEFGQIPSSIV